MGKFVKIILVDFDGVIHGYQSGWKGADVAEDPPVPGAIKFLERLVEHPELEAHIYSSRSKEPKGFQCMRRYLLGNGLSEGHLADIRFPTEKPPAWLTIDDRCFSFDGVFPTVEWIEDFQPWYKRWSRDDEVSRAYMAEVEARGDVVERNVFRLRNAGTHHTDRIKEEAGHLLGCIEARLPPSRERSLAITKLEECVMWAVKGATAKGEA